MRANRGRGPLLHWPCISESSGISDLTLWLGLYSGINLYSYSARPLLPEQGAGGHHKITPRGLPLAFLLGLQKRYRHKSG